MTQISKRTFLRVSGGALAAATSAQAQNPIGKRRIMQGPMLGAITPAAVKVWVRLSDPRPVQVEYSRSALMTDTLRTAPVTPSDGDDYTARIDVTGLEPDTIYYYRILVDGQRDDYQRGQPPFSMKTAPAPGWRGQFRIGFGSCARIQEDPVQPIWPVVDAAEPDLFFWLGDNIYADTRSLHVFQEEYRRQRMVPALQPLLRSAGHLATWDDHDFGLNDHDRTNPIKDIGLTAFKQYWANPSYGLDGVPGVFFKYEYGGIDFFVLDGRYYRDPNADTDTPAKTMLGAAQLQWLKDGLKQSKAPFKMLVSGSGWSKAKGPGGDAWSAFLNERDALFRFIRDESISGVVLMSGDTHVGEANCIPFSEQGGYDLYDLTSSPLAQTPTDSWQERRPEIRLRNPVYESPNAGVMHFDTSPEDPSLTYYLMDINGRIPRAPITLVASELRNGVTSWSEKIDRTERERLESYRSGGPYYIPLKYD